MTTKDDLRRLIDELPVGDVESLVDALRTRRSLVTPSQSSRPLTTDDIIRTEPVMPDEETADELIATVRRWRREGGYA